jgi:hypothetical protein
VYDVSGRIPLKVGTTLLAGAISEQDSDPDISSALVSGV